MTCNLMNSTTLGCGLQGVSGQVKDRVEKAAAGKLDPTTRPLLLFPEVRSHILAIECVYPQDTPEKSENSVSQEALKLRYLMTQQALFIIPSTWCCGTIA